MLRSRKVINDPSRFEGEGISFRAKLIGIEDVKEARGDQMCQEAIVKLKNAIRIAGGHKRRIIININLQGIKITDAISMVALHSHPVHQVSFISRDPTDSRAFGYICETDDGLHKYFAIKTATAAEQVVLALKDLFQAVVEAKKKGVDPSSADKEETNASGENQQTSQNDQTSAGTPSADAEHVVQVDAAAINLADTAIPEVNTQPSANLFDFEDQSGRVVQGGQQMRSLELEFLTDDVPQSASSPATSPLESVAPSVTAATATTDPWGLAAPETSPSKAPPTNTSALDDLAGIQTGFSTNFSLHTGFGTSSSFNPGLPAAKDPFGTAPFSPFSNQSPAAGVPGPRQQSFPAGFTITNPFGSESSQPFGVPGVPPRPVASGAYSMFPGVIPHGVTSAPATGGSHNPFATQQSSGLQFVNPFGDSSNLFQNDQKDSGADSSAASPDVLNARAKSPHDHLFSDLLDIKKPSPARAKSPRDMFSQIAAADRKSLNDLIGASPRASPVPAALLKPSTSPRASPVPAALLKPGTSPRASPVPMAQNIPASPLLVQNAPLLSPQASSVPVLQDAPTQSGLLDDFFGS